MSRSAAGTAENPGRNIRQKSGLHRSILDQSRGEFRRQLDYKAHWAGGDLVTVLPSAKTQTRNARFAGIRIPTTGKANPTATVVG